MEDLPGTEHLSLARQDLQPVRLSSLISDTVTDFDLYLQIKGADRLVLYRKSELPFTEEVRLRLLQSDVESLFVPRDQKDAYRRYVERNLPNLLDDTSIPTEEKSELLYLSASGLMQDVMADPRSGEMIPRSREFIEGSLDYLLHREEAFAGLLKVLSSDYYTYTHSVNVFTYTVALCQRLGGWDRDLLREIGEGALLHDVGKSQIDPDIITSSGKLTELEWEAMRMHPVYGEEILREQQVTSRIVLEIARHHHEKLDGSGYPDGISGDTISRYVRVVTVADIFDAMTTQRAYRSADNSFNALTEMKQAFTGKLDDQIFTTFVDLMAHPERQ